jgi:hypothetical protein
MTDWARRRSIWRGILQLARFNADGLREFGDTPQAFLNSLAPLLAFPLVGGAMTLLGAGPRGALANILVSLIALLAPPVLSHLLASFWHREALWLRYAVAFNWCEAAVFLAVVILLVLFAGRFGMESAVWTLPAYVYWAVLHGFLAKRALRVSLLRAVVMVVFVNFGSFVLMVLPVALLASVDLLARSG